MEVTRVSCAVGLLLCLGGAVPTALFAQDTAEPAALGLTTAAWPSPESSPPTVVDGPLEPITWPSLTDAYEQCRFSVQVMDGFYTSLHRFGPRPVLDYELAPIDVRLGVMLWDPWPEGRWFASNAEILLDLTTAPVTRGPGSYVVGPSLLLRGNLVPPGSPVVPYLQGGAGIVYNDSYRDQSQRNLGRSQEFYLTTVIGLHFQVNPSCSLDVEGGYLHISNACLADRNMGINAVGGSIGFTYTFGCGRHR